MIIYEYSTLYILINTEFESEASLLHLLTDLSLVKSSFHLQHLQLCRSGLKLHYIWFKMRQKF
jgi:hypothetical protein